MPPREIAPIPTLAWQDLLHHAKFSRQEVRTALAMPFNKMSIVRTEDGCRIYALGTPPSQSTQTLLAGEYNANVAEKKGFSRIRLEPVINFDEMKTSGPSLEFSLVCERQRAAVVYGIADYAIGSEPSNLVLNSGDELYRFSSERRQMDAVGIKPMPDTDSMEADNLSVKSDSSNKGPTDFVSDAKICPCDNELIAYVLNRQVVVDKAGHSLYTTTLTDGVSCGVASYIAQEELDRFDAIWWSPNMRRLLYEQVDERNVHGCAFTCPGKTPTTPMKYPRAGLSNATSELRLIVVGGADDVHDVGLVTSLKCIYPAVEYVARAGFASDGTTVWVQLMNREQDQCVLVLIPEEEFAIPQAGSMETRYPTVGEQLIINGQTQLGHAKSAFIDGVVNGYHMSSSISMSTSMTTTTTTSSSLKSSKSFLKTHRIIHTIDSHAWVNVGNAIISLDTANPREEFNFIYTKEGDKGSALMIIRVVFAETGELVRNDEVQLLPPDVEFSICKASSMHVDQRRRLVYFIANCSHPTEYNLCVASYAEEGRSNFKQLTEKGLSIKNERSSPALALHRDVGFACWMTSLGQQQHCRFYALLHSASGELPEARHIANIEMPGSGMTASLLSAFISVQVPELVEFQLKESAISSYALVMRPPNYDSSRSYPVVHYVYGGPGIQLVRNDFSTWLPFQKYTRVGFIVVMLDGRGSANRGLGYEAPIKHSLGYYEVEDQLAGLKMVAERCQGLLDMNRVVVTGWSYGGFMSLMMLARYPKVYRAAIAGGAVINWRLYDTAYTERYLGYPLSECYDYCSVTKFVKELPDEPGRLMVVHGLMDENVHFTHTETLIETLIKRGKPYELQLFPSERHGIRNADSAAYLDASIIRFMCAACRT